MAKTTCGYITAVDIICTEPLYSLQTYPVHILLQQLMLNQHIPFDVRQSTPVAGLDTKHSGRLISADLVILFSSLVGPTHVASFFPFRSSVSIGNEVRERKKSGDLPPPVI